MKAQFEKVKETQSVVKGTPKVLKVTPASSSSSSVPMPGKAVVAASVQSTKQIGELEAKREDVRQSLYHNNIALSKGWWGNEPLKLIAKRNFTAHDSEGNMRIVKELSLKELQDVEAGISKARQELRAKATKVLNLLGDNSLISWVARGVLEKDRGASISNYYQVMNLEFDSLVIYEKELEEYISKREAEEKAYRQTNLGKLETALTSGLSSVAKTVDKNVNYFMNGCDPSQDDDK